MEIIADLHLHSKYSRAVSQNMVVSQIALWAGKKGIRLVGSGDFTHPLWLRELKENLKEVSFGLYALKSQEKEINNSQSLKKEAPLFLLTTEIASIYSQEGKSHRIHNLIFAPDFKTVEEINLKLRSREVNLFSDGRPITGLSSQAICELVLSVNKDCLVIPAHIWTPWFSLYGSNSGFDSLKECFGEFAPQIKAIETGLSSDPAMNWRIEELDGKSILSFSDAHSPQKLGREATVFEVSKENKLDYEQIKKAIANQQIAYTIEFYPEEGKYHWSGHRTCQVKQSPPETARLGTTCPVCGRRLTVGVMHRVEQLARRSAEEVVVSRDHWVKSTADRPPYVMSVPLMEILAEVSGTSVLSQAVEGQYERLVASLGSEFNVLLKTPLEAISKVGGPKLAQAIQKVRGGEIFVDPGYDGVFGVVKIWSAQKEEEGQDSPGGSKQQMSLF